MASSNTALSKTAINALRGVLFTTSCSVILLAEERRRRIKIARAAVDNARRIHAVKHSRGPMAGGATEPFSLEARLAELEAEALQLNSADGSYPGPTNRRQSISLHYTDNSQSVESHHSQTRPHDPRPEKTNDKSINQATKISENTIDSILKSARVASYSTNRGNTSDSRPFDDGENCSHDKTDKTETLLSKANQTPGAVNETTESAVDPLEAMFKHRRTTDFSPKSTSSAEAAASSSEDVWAILDRKPTQNAVGQTTQNAVNRTTQSAVDPLEMVLKYRRTTGFTQKTKSTAKAAAVHLQSSSEEVSARLDSVRNTLQAKQTASITAEKSSKVQDAAPRVSLDAQITRGQDPKLQAAVTSLSDVVAALRPIDETNVNLNALEKSTNLLRHIASHGRAPKAYQQQLRTDINAMLQFSFNSPNTIIDILSTSLPMFQDPASILQPFLVWLEANQQDQSQQVTRGILECLTLPARSDLWRDGLYVLDMIHRMNKKHPGGELAPNVYRLLVSAGLFGNVKVPQDVEIQIRCAMVEAYAKAGNQALISHEIKALSHFESADPDVQFQLDAAAVMEQAARGEWKAVLDALGDILHTGEHVSFAAWRFVRQLTAMYAKPLTVRDIDRLESWIRHLTNTYGMVPRNEEVHAVLDGYAHYHDIDGMGAWLQFCVEHGLKIDVAFVKRLAKSCRHYFYFDEDCSKVLAQRLSEVTKVLSCQTYRVTDRKRNIELTRRMTEICWTAQYEQVLATFEAALSEPQIISARSFRLAMKAQIRLEGLKLEPALALLRRAQDAGIDIGFGLKHLLLIWEHHRGNGMEVLGRLVEEGIELNQQNYMLVTRMVIAEGNMVGSRKLLQDAADQMNQQRDVYDAMSFARNLFVLVTTGNVRGLRRLVDQFTATDEYWHYSYKTLDCIRASMNAAAKRIVTPINEEFGSRCEEMMLILEQAMDHRLACEIEPANHEAVLAMVVKAVAEGQKQRAMQMGESGGLRVPKRSPKIRLGKKTEVSLARPISLRAQGVAYSHA